MDDDDLDDTDLVRAAVETRARDFVRGLSECDRMLLWTVLNTPYPKYGEGPIGGEGAPRGQELLTECIDDLVSAVQGDEGT